LTAGGETKLQEIWRPSNGRQNVTIELPFPASAGLDETINMLEAGRGIEYRVELSLLDGGYEIGGILGAAAADAVMPYESEVVASLAVTLAAALACVMLRILPR
jgi:hypothetical protein